MNRDAEAAKQLKEFFSAEQVKRHKRAKRLLIPKLIDWLHCWLREPMYKSEIDTSELNALIEEARRDAGDAS